MPQKTLPHQLNQTSLGKRILAGAATGLLLISLFLLGVRDPNPEWGKLWMVQPLVIVPVAGAIGGLCNYLIMSFHLLVGVNKTIAMVLSAVVFIVGLWMGVVLGLHGTMWN
jgi:hypothetical protein